MLHNAQVATINHLRMKKKNTITVILTAIILGALVWRAITENTGKGKNKMQGKQPPKVDAFIVHPVLLTNKIMVTGSLVSFDEVNLENEVAGRVVMIHLPEGKFVKKGTLLVKLFDDDLQAQLKKLQAQLAVQQQIAKRQAELLKVNGISQNDYDQTVLQVNSIKADIEVEKTMIRKTEVKAPFDGVIGLRNISVGAIINPSTVLATIRTANKLKLDFFVPEKYSSMIIKGMKVNFTLSGENHQHYATVIATEEGIDNSTRSMKVRAMVDDPGHELIAGSYTNVELQLGQNPNALMVPTLAIIPNEDKKTVIVAHHGKATFVEVETGIRNLSKIEVTKGLQAGDTIIISGIMFLNEGTPLHYSSVTR